MSSNTMWALRKRIGRYLITCLLVLVPLAILGEVMPGTKDDMPPERSAEGPKVKGTNLAFMGGLELKGLLDQYRARFAEQHDDFKPSFSCVRDNVMAAACLRHEASPAFMTRPLTAEEFEGCVDDGVMPTSHLVACDALAVVVHASNPVQQVTVEQLRDVYTGKIKNWKELGGPDGKIQLLSLRAFAGLQDANAFFERLMVADTMVDDVEVIREREALVERARRSRLAIGYVRAAMALGPKDIPAQVKVLSLNGVALTKESVRNGDYPLAWPVLLYTNGYPEFGSGLHRLVTLHLSKEGQSLIEAGGYVPVTSYK